MPMLLLIGEVNWENMSVIGMAACTLAWLVKTYVPKIIEHHLAFVTAVEKQGERQTAALENLATRDVGVERINEALSHGVRAASAMVAGHEREAAVTPHLDQMRRTLGK